MLQRLPDFLTLGQRIIGRQLNYKPRTHFTTVIDPDRAAVFFNNLFDYRQP
jgi:hypothetical protein